MAQKKRVALLLSAGAAKGFAHLGVLKVLEKNRVPIDLIIGTSMGSLVGAHYALVPNAEMWIKKLSKFSVFQLIGKEDFRIKGLKNLILRKGAISGKTIKELLDKNLGGAKFEDTVIPFMANAVDMSSDQCVKFEKGKLSDAVRASIGVPGVFDVLIHKKQVIIDGGLIDPIGSLWLKGTYDLVIVVNVNNVKKGEVNKKTPFFDVLLKSMELMQEELVHEKIKKIKNAVLIEPNLKGLRYTDFHKSKEFVRRGEEAGRKAMKEIKKYL